ncbi:MAG: hypothetical protein ACFB21_14330 [Opitutales bacterium]
MSLPRFFPTALLGAALMGGAISPVEAAPKAQLGGFDVFYEALFDYKAQYLDWFNDLSSSEQNNVRSRWWADPADNDFADVIEFEAPAYFLALTADTDGRSDNLYPFYAWFRSANPTALEQDLLSKRVDALRQELPPGDPLRADLDGLLANPGSTSEARMGLYCLLVEYGVAVEELAKAEQAQTWAAAHGQGALANQWSPLANALAGLRPALEARLSQLRQKILARGVPAEPRVLLGAIEAQAAALSVRSHGIDTLVFAQRTQAKGFHWYESFGYWADRYSDNLEQWNIQKQGRLVTLDLDGLAETTLLNDPGGSYRDPCVSFDGQRILFSHRPGGQYHSHLYEVTADGSGLRQLTDGPDDDIEPIYLPNGDLVFCSSRQRRWVPCLNAQVAILHRSGPDGENIRSLTANVETENTPWIMPDGRLLFMRWEYVERDRGLPHGLWTINPDGTGIMTYWGNMDEPDVFIDAKPIPGTNEIIFIRHPHGSREHIGTIAVLHPDDGPDEDSVVRNVTPDTDLDMVRGYRDPWPVAPGLYLACQRDRLYVLNDAGTRLLLHKVPAGWIHEPRPLMAVETPPDITPRVKLSESTGKLVLADVNVSRNMEGVAEGEVDHLLLMEILPKPVHHDGHTENLSYNGNFFMERILGEVPVEDDGSAYFEVPALRNIFMVAMDEDGNALKRMQSFVTVQPGETVSCVGCHEPRTLAPPGTKPLKALTRPPSQIEKPEGIPGIFHFPRDIQPILDRHCVSCHSSSERAGDVVLDGDLDPWFNQAYVTIKTRDLVQAGFGGVGNSGNLPARSVGAGASQLYQMMRDGHGGVALAREELKMVYYWIESWAQYSGTFAFLNKENNVRNPVSLSLLNNRCSSCHGGGSNNLFFQGAKGGPSRADIRETFGLRVNLSEPEASLLLRAPLSEAAGGLGLCRDRGAVDFWGARNKPNYPLDTSDPPANVFTSRNDPAYQQILSEIQAFAADNLATHRMEVAETPLPERVWVQEMQRNGILEEDFNPAGKDVAFYFAVDEAYYQSSWWVPQRPTGHPLAAAGPDVSVSDADGNGFELVTVDASGSLDENGSLVEYRWTWNAGSATGVSTQLPIMTGSTVVTLTVTDNEGNTATDTLVITVTTPANFTFFDDFSQSFLSGWQEAPGRPSGRWSVTDGAATLEANQGNPARILYHPSDGTWADFRLTLELTPGDNDPIGVLWSYQDASNHYGFYMTNDYRGGPRMVLFKSVDGLETVLDSTIEAFVEGQTYTFVIEVENGGQMTITDGASILLSAPTPVHFSEGGVAFYSDYHENGRWDNVSIEPLAEPIVNPDADGDGLVDLWELSHFGHLDGDGLGDYDGDAQSDGAEARAGTSPTDPQSRFFAFLESNDVLCWSPCLSDRRYRVLCSSDLPGAEWREIPVSPVVSDGVAEVILPDLSQPPYNIPADKPMFFRIEVLTEDE